MSKILSIKEKITEVVINELPDHLKIPHKDAMIAWWMNIRKEGGLRLTAGGDLAFRTAQIEFYECAFFLDREDPAQKIILEMNKKLKCPYYLGVNKNNERQKTPYIRLYDSKIAMLIELYGTVQEYLKSIRTTK